MHATAREVERYQMERNIRNDSAGYLWLRHAAVAQQYGEITKDRLVAALARAFDNGEIWFFLFVLNFMLR